MSEAKQKMARLRVWIEAICVITAILVAGACSLFAAMDTSFAGRTGGQVWPRMLALPLATISIISARWGALVFGIDFLIAFAKDQPKLWPITEWSPTGFDHLMLTAAILLFIAGWCQGSRPGLLPPRRRPDPQVESSSSVRGTRDNGLT